MRRKTRWLLAALCVIAAFLCYFFMPGGLSTEAAILITGLEELLLLGLPALLILSVKEERLPRIKAEARLPSPLILGCMLLCAVSVTVTGGMLAEFWTEFLEGFGYARSGAGAFIPQGAVQWALSILCMAAIPALCEELFYRELLQQGLKTRVSARAALLITAAAFTVSHGSLEAAPALLLIAVILGFLREKHGLCACALFHFSYNVLVLYLNSLAVGITMIALLLCACALYLSLSLLRRES